MKIKRKQEKKNRKGKKKNVKKQNKTKQNQNQKKKKKKTDSTHDVIFLFLEYLFAFLSNIRRSFGLTTHNCKYEKVHHSHINLP